MQFFEKFWFNKKSKFIESLKKAEKDPVDSSMEPQLIRILEQIHVINNFGIKIHK